MGASRAALLSHTQRVLLGAALSLVPAGALAQSSPTTGSTAVPATTTVATGSQQAPTEAQPQLVGSSQAPASEPGSTVAPATGATPAPTTAPETATAHAAQGSTAAPATASAHGADSAPPATVRMRFGQGVIFSAPNDLFELNIRARAQARFTLTAEGGDTEPPATEFSIRRMRLLFQGHAFSRSVQYYFQLGFSNRDTEPDLRLPLRDAYVTYTAIRDLQIRAGQMKVPFDRQRVVSSSALQMVDRSIVTGELNLDRDVGIQFFSRDLFGLGRRLGYQLGVFGGDGRNRLANNFGLLYVARLEFTPFGSFDDYVEADVERLNRPRLSIAAGFAFNHNSNRSQSTLGTTYTLGTFNYLHGEADVMFKYAGFSLLGQVMIRQATEAMNSRVDPMTGMVSREFSRNFWGWFVQTGYLFTRNFETVLRFGDLRPIVLDAVNVDTTQRTRREMGLGLNWYFLAHSLKIQADYFYYFGEQFNDRVEHQARVQMQLFF